MSSFKFRARDRAGKIVEGFMEADDRKSVVAELHGSGRLVLDVREVRSRSESGGEKTSAGEAAVKYVYNPLFGGAAPNELAVFYRQFATMVRSGMTLAQSMASLVKQGGNNRLRKIAEETAIHLQSGGRLSEAFGRYPWMFPDLHVHLIQAGEMSGRLDIILDRIASYLEWETRIRQKLRLATLYPKILVLAVIFIPKLPVLVLGTFQQYIHETLGQLWMVAIGLVVLWAGFKLLHQIPSFRVGLDNLKIAFPKLGKMVKMLALSRFYRSTAMLYSSGAPLSQALKLGARSSGNAYLEKRLLTAIPPVEKGRSLVEALEQTEVLPVMAVNMLRTGEATGSVDEMFEKTAEYTENETEVAIFQTTTILGVLLLLGIAGYIGSFILQFYTKYYSGIVPQ